VGDLELVLSGREKLNGAEKKHPPAVHRLECTGELCHEGCLLSEETGRVRHAGEGIRMGGLAWFWSSRHFGKRYKDDVGSSYLQSLLGHFHVIREGCSKGAVGEATRILWITDLGGSEEQGLRSGPQM